MNRPENGTRWGMPTPPPGITQLLMARGHGDEVALNRMTPLVHRELQSREGYCSSAHAWYAIDWLRNSSQSSMNEIELPPQRTGVVPFGPLKTGVVT